MHPERGGAGQQWRHKKTQIETGKKMCKCQGKASLGEGERSTWRRRDPKVRGCRGRAQRHLAAHTKVRITHATGRGIPHRRRWGTGHRAAE